MSLVSGPFSAARAACLALLVAAALPCGGAWGATFSRDPSANGWTKVGNSITQATANFGGWASGSSTASFDVYSGQFVLSASDTVSKPSAGNGTGDCYLASGGAKAGGCEANATNAGSGWLADDTAEVAVLIGEIVALGGDCYLASGGEKAGGCEANATNAGSGWLAGDTIVALGVKWVGRQQGLSIGALGLSFDPLGTSSWTAGTAFSSPGNTSFSNNSSDGSFSFSVYADQEQVQNRSPYGIYRINPPGKTGAPGSCAGVSIADGCPYGAVEANWNNVSTSAQPDNGSNTPQGTLPVRVFGNRNSDGWDYYTAFLNQSLMQRNGYGEAAFGSAAKWVVSAGLYGCTSNCYVSATGPMNVRPARRVPGPLPLLGAGAAFGWSRRLRQRARLRPSRS